MGTNINDATRCVWSSQRDLVKRDLVYVCRLHDHIIGHMAASPDGSSWGIIPLCSILLTKKIRRLPVVDEEGRLLGLLSRRDIVNAAFTVRGGRVAWHLRNILMTILTSILQRQVRKAAA